MHLSHVARGILVEDGDVGAKALQPPVLLRTQHLAHQGQIAILNHAHDQDRQVAGDAVRPEARLPERVSREERGGGAQRGVGPQHIRGEPIVELRFIGRDPEVTQPHLGLGGGEREGAGGRGGIVVFLRQRDGGGSARGDAGRKREAHLPAGGDAHAPAQAQDRVEHRSRGARERPAVERNGVFGRASATEESRAVGLPLDGAVDALLGAQHVHRPRRQLVGGSWAAAAQKGRAFGAVLGLEE